MMFKEQFDSLADEFVEAIISDFADPEFREGFRHQVDAIVSRKLGIDVNSVLVKPFWDKLYNQGIEQLKPLVGLVVSDPPDSIDVSASVIKEEVGEKIDSVADKLKKRLEEKKNQRSLTSHG